jgi:spore coat protein U-like protein
MNVKRCLSGLGWMALCLVAASGRAQAACTISTTPVAFGNYDVFSPTDLDSTGTVTIQCHANDKDVTVWLDRGGSPSFNPRTLVKAGEPLPLNYNLYTDGARSIIWGDCTAGTSCYGPARPGNRPVMLTVYGRIPAGQDASAGLYQATVVATVNW